MQLINTSNGGVVSTSEELGEQLLVSGIYEKHPKKPARQTAKPKAAEGKEEE